MPEMATKMDATLEHLRIGAIKGQILDADGSALIYDLFTEFGVTPRHPAQDRGRARRAAVRAHPRHLRRRFLRRPNQALGGCEGV
jgi:hypothetical protein